MESMDMDKLMNLERKFKKIIAGNVRVRMTMKCPTCNKEITITHEKKQCPACNADINIKFDIMY